MKVTALAIPEVLVIEPTVHRDARGFFMEYFQKQRYAEAGMALPFVQDNHSRSSKNILRGLHHQTAHPQGKLVRCTEGEIYDVAVDIRRGSPSFGQWVSVTLTADNFKQIYVPPNFAHGFCVVSETAQVEYKTTDFYDPSSEVTLLWNDPAVGIEWPVDDPRLSGKDAQGKTLEELGDLLPQYKG